MDDGKCLLDVIDDPQALDVFLTNPSGGHNNDVLANVLSASGCGDVRKENYTVQQPYANVSPALQQQQQNITHQSATVLASAGLGTTNALWNSHGGSVQLQSPASNGTTVVQQNALSKNVYIPNQASHVAGNNSLSVTGVQNSLGVTGVQNSLDVTGVQNSLGVTSVQNSLGVTGVQNSLGVTGVQNSLGVTGMQNVNFIPSNRDQLDTNNALQQDVNCTPASNLGGTNFQELNFGCNAPQRNEQPQLASVPNIVIQNQNQSITLPANQTVLVNTTINGRTVVLQLPVSQLSALQTHLAKLNAQNAGHGGTNVQNQSPASRQQVPIQNLSSGLTGPVVQTQLQDQSRVGSPLVPVQGHYVIAAKPPLANESGKSQVASSNFNSLATDAHIAPVSVSAVVTNVDNKLASSPLLYQQLKLPKDNVKQARTPQNVMLQNVLNHQSPGNNSSIGVTNQSQFLPAGVQTAVKPVVSNVTVSCNNPNVQSVQWFQQPLAVSTAQLPISQNTVIAQTAPVLSAQQQQFSNCESSQSSSIMPQYAVVQQNTAGQSTQLNRPSFVVLQQPSLQPRAQPSILLQPQAQHQTNVLLHPNSQNSAQVTGNIVLQTNQQGNLLVQPGAQTSVQSQVNQPQIIIGNSQSAMLLQGGKLQQTVLIQQPGRPPLQVNLPVDQMNNLLKSSPAAMQSASQQLQQQTAAKTNLVESTLAPAASATTLVPGQRIQTIQLSLQNQQLLQKIEVMIRQLLGVKNHTQHQKQALQQLFRKQQEIIQIGRDAAIRSGIESASALTQAPRVIPSVAISSQSRAAVTSQTTTSSALGNLLNKSAPAGTQQLVKIGINSASQPVIGLQPAACSVKKATPAPPNQVKITPQKKISSPSKASICHQSHKATKRAPEKTEVRTSSAKMAKLTAQIKRDQNMIVKPETDVAFKSVKHACRSLIRYHILAGTPQHPRQLEKIDHAFEEKSKQLQTRFHHMLNKFHRLLLRESQRQKPSWELVHINRMLVQKERDDLRRDKEAAERGEYRVPEGFQLKDISDDLQEGSSAPSPASSTPPSPLKPDLLLDETAKEAKSPRAKSPICDNEKLTAVSKHEHVSLMNNTPAVHTTASTSVFVPSVTSTAAQVQILPNIVSVPTVAPVSYSQKACYTMQLPPSSNSAAVIDINKPPGPSVIDKPMDVLESAIHQAISGDDSDMEEDGVDEVSENYVDDTPNISSATVSNLEAGAKQESVRPQKLTDSAPKERIEHLPNGEISDAELEAATRPSEESRTAVQGLLCTHPSLDLVGDSICDITKPNELVSNCALLDNNISDADVDSVVALNSSRVSPKCRNRLKANDDAVNEQHVKEEIGYTNNNESDDQVQSAITSILTTTEQSREVYEYANYCSNDLNDTATSDIEASPASPSLSCNKVQKQKYLPTNECTESPDGNLVIPFATENSSTDDYTYSEDNIAADILTQQYEFHTKDYPDIDYQEQFYVEHAEGIVENGHAENCVISAEDQQLDEAVRSILQ